MDPDCAICRRPAEAACDCEAKGLDMAIKQAEDAIMRSIYSDIRTWVRGHAQDYILEYFRQLADRRKNAHSDHLDQITSQAYYHYKMPPHPQQIADANHMLKKGIDEDWKASVERYPEVLEYFFGLVELTLPADSDPQVANPPLNGQHGGRKGPRRTHAGPSVHDGPPAITSASYANMIGGIPPRTPPPFERRERRSTAPRDKRSSRQSVPPPQPQHAPYQPYHHAPYM